MDNCRSEGSLHADVEAPVSMLTMLDGGCEASRHDRDQGDAFWQLCCYGRAKNKFNFVEAGATRLNLNHVLFELLNLHL